MPIWAWPAPTPSLGVRLTTGVAGVGALLAELCVVVLPRTVIAAVYHADVLAHRAGEPCDPLVVARAVLVIAASLILSIMLVGGDPMAALPCGTIFAATTIICDDVVGLRLLVGGRAHCEQFFRVEDSSVGMAVLAAIPENRAPRT